MRIELEEKIYTYGSRLEEHDYMGRDIFVCLVAFLNLVIKQEVWYYNVECLVKALEKGMS